MDTTIRNILFAIIMYACSTIMYLIWYKISHNALEEKIIKLEQEKKNLKGEKKHDRRKSSKKI